jgi:hypothetical protein
LSTGSWLGDWLQSEGIPSTSQLDRALKDMEVRKRLWSAAAEVPYTTVPLPQLTGPAILAGKAIDLSGELDCCLAWDCRQRDIDSLFSKVWHYFDNIVLVGPSAANIRQAIEDDNEDWALLKTRADAQLLFYLRDVGAEEMVLFREKPPACLEHMAEHARSVGIGNVDDLIETEARRLASGARIKVQPHDDHLDYSLNHDLLEHRRWGAVPLTEDEREVELAACRDVAADFAAHLTSDMRAACALRLPLGAVVNIHGDMLARIQGGILAEDVAFNLEFPVLRGISPRDLLILRQDEHESFEVFRNALRKAIEERIARTKDPQAVISEIQRDLIAPALADISLRLRRAEESLNSKHRINIALGVISVACGLLGDPSLAVAFTAATAVGAATVESKAIDDKRAIALSEMYFLWKAKEMSNRH